MGMSSSQARLLTLTARMHDIEHRAQKIEADKLRLANDSRKAYEDYLIALDSKKIQYKSIASNGSVTFRDATMNIMQNGTIPGYEGEHAMKSLFLQNQQGMIMVTPAVAEEFGLESWAATSSMDDYIESITGKHKSTREVLSGYHFVDTDTIQSVSLEPNTLVRAESMNPEYDYIENSEAANLIDYDNFQIPVTPTNTSSMTELTDAEVVANGGGNYKISTAASLQKLAMIGSVTKGNNFYLANDIDLSGYTWTGIVDFAGNFDGNGMTVSNLTGSYGLFRNTTEATTIKNVRLKNANITATTSECGGIVGSFYSGTIENCVVIGTMSFTSWSGGIVGAAFNGVANIKNCNTHIDITNGSGCVGGIEGHGDSSATSILDTCWTTGNISASHSGGLIGHNQGSTTVKDCITTAQMDPSKASTGLVIGYGSGSGFTFINVAYEDQPGVHIAGDDPAYTGDRGSFVKLISTPSVDPTDFSGGFYSNVYGAIIKNAGGDINAIDPNKVKDYVRNLYNSANSGIKIANINEYLCDFLKGGSVGSFMSDLLSDVTSGTITRTTSSYQDRYDSAEYTVTIPETGDTWDPFVNSEKGEYAIPHIQTMAEEVYYLLNSQGKNDVTMEDVKNWFNSHYSTTDIYDKQYLANLNDVIVTKNIDTIYDAIKNGTKLEPTTQYNPSKYDISFKPYSAPTYTWKQERIDEYTTEEYWDTTDPEIAQAMVWWLVAQRGVIVVTEEQASSYKYLNNIMEVGEAVLTTFNPGAVSVLTGMSEADIMAMTDEEYNELMGIVNTNVAVELTVTEVADEKGLKKAEADYEAKLRLIDRKDRQYDTQLAAVETERNAIKQEMETLKTVINDNGERTFKLFS